jgi:phosphohistidine phosphatase
MKTLLILRHSKSKWKDSKQDDHERTLTKRGRKDAQKMGGQLRDNDLLPDLIVSSTARRCRKTAEHVIHNSGYRGVTKITGELYEAGADAIHTLVNGLPDGAGRVLMIGHNPGLEQFLQSIVGTHTPLATSALARVEIPVERWTEFGASTRGNLIHIWLPGDKPKKEKPAPEETTLPESS